MYADLVINNVTHQIPRSVEHALFASGAIIVLDEDDCTYQLNPEHDFTYEEVIMLLTGDD